MKKTIISTLVLGIALSATSVFAESNNDDVRIPTTPDVSYVNSASENTETVRTNSLSRIKSRGMQLIDERIRALNGNKYLITTNTKLTADQKTALSTILTNNINGLTTLRGTLASSTDATSTKDLFKSIYVDFRIYAVVLPQVRLEKRIYDLKNHSVKLSETFVKTQTKIDEGKAKGKDVTEWQKQLDDAKVLVANDMFILDGLFTKVSALKPSDYGTTSKMVIESTNAELKKVAKDFNSIGKMLRRPVLRSNLPEVSSLSLATITLFSNKDPNPTTGAINIVWITSKSAKVALDMVCTSTSTSFVTDKGNHPSCDKGGVWTWQWQNEGSIFVTSLGNVAPITVPFTLTVLDRNGVYTNEKQTISITFPAASH